MNLKQFILVLMGAAVMGGCAFEESQGIDLMTEVYNFAASPNGWTHGFSDYPAAREDSARFELQYEYKTFQGVGGAVMLSGNNLNSDLFMFLKKKMSGLKANTSYTLSFDVEIACASEEATVGSGGYGEKVYLKVGGSGMEPKSLIDGELFEMNINKGKHDDDGADMRFVGTLTSPYSSGEYTKINLNNTAIDNPFVVKTNSRGELWLIVGADSDFQGKISLYYTKIAVVITSSI